MDPEKWLKDGEANVEWAKEMLKRLQVEGTDIRRGAVVLGDVAATFPRMTAALADKGVTPDNVEGVWVVPGFIVKDLDGALRWHDVRGRLGPFLKNNLWSKIDAEVRQGLAVDWTKMGLLKENVVVVRHKRELREMARSAYAQLTLAGTMRLLRGAYAGCTREWCFSLLVSLWPFRWWWLFAWLALDLAIYASHKLTADVLPFTWHDTIMIWLLNAMGFAYALKHRAETDGHLSDAHKFKVAGSVALRKGKLDVAVEQYLLGEECAAKLDGVWYLNGAFCARGPPLRLACLNNAALARLKQKEWEKAAELCVRALALEGVARRSGGDETVAAAEVVQRYRLPRAKSYFRLAVARAKLGDVDLAREALLSAHDLVPTDEEVVGMLRVLEWGEEQRRRQAATAEDVADALALEASLRGSPMPPLTGQPRRRADGSPQRVQPMPAPLKNLDVAAAERARAAYGAILNPRAESDASGFGAWAPEEGKPAAKGTEASAAPAIATAATATAATATTAAAAHPTPPRASAGGPQRALKFGWCREWLSTQLVGLAVQDAEGNFIGIHELRGLRGEAYVEERVVRAGRSGSGERTAVKEGQEEMAAEERITTRHVYDLSLSLSWKAKLAGGTYEGAISLSEVASHSEPSEYEVTVQVSEEAGPHEGSAAQMLLVGLLGPLRCEAALAAEGRLTQQMWTRLLAFRDAYAKLKLSN